MRHKVLEFVVEIDRKGRDQPRKKGRNPAALCPGHWLSLGKGLTSMPFPVTFAAIVVPVAAERKRQE
jgi:hypothetical protein